MLWASHHLEKGNLNQTDWINVVYVALRISPQGYSVGGLATAQYELCVGKGSAGLGGVIKFLSGGPGGVPSTKQWEVGSLGSTSTLQHSHSLSS